MLTTHCHVLRFHKNVGTHNNDSAKCLLSVDVGLLLSVNPYVAQRIPSLLNLNERVVYIGKWQHGFMALGAVGATIVGSVRVYHDPVSLFAVFAEANFVIWFYDIPVSCILLLFTVNSVENKP